MQKTMRAVRGILGLGILFALPVLMAGCGGEKAETGEAVSPDVQNNLLQSTDASAAGNAEAAKTP